MMDGFKLYSHCKVGGNFLKSCWKQTDVNNGGENESDYSFSTDNCELDKANGYDFTGKGVTDSTGAEITGYAYVASEAYPFLMAYLHGKVDCAYVTS